MSRNLWKIPEKESKITYKKSAMQFYSEKIYGKIKMVKVLQNRKIILVHFI